jgi:hypothetical protein
VTDMSSHIPDENPFVQWVKRTFEALTPAEKKKLRPLFRILYFQIVLLFVAVFMLIFAGILALVFGIAAVVPG